MHLQVFQDSSELGGYIFCGVGVKEPELCRYPQMAVLLPVGLMETAQLSLQPSKN